MVELIAPTLAYGRYGYKYLRMKGLVKAPPSKYHLRRASDTGTNVMKMVCGMMMETQDELTQTVSVKQLKATDICKRCQGALIIK